MVEGLKKRFEKLSLSVRISLAVILIVAVVTLLVSYVLNQYEEKNQLSELVSREHLHLELNSDRLQQTIDEVRRDVIFLSQTPPVQGIIRASRNNGYDKLDPISLSTWRARLQKIFVEFAKARPNYFQIRYVGVADHGRELVRVEDNQGQVSITPEDKLQEKAGRAYFEDAIKLKPGEVYLSRINLNREWGKIQVPHIRTLRGATPVFTPEGELFGIIVVNYDLGGMLDAVAENAGSDVATYLVNNGGDFLIHPDRARTFGFDLGHRYRWQDEFPEVALQVAAQYQNSRKIEPFTSSQGNIYVFAKRVAFDPRDSNRLLTLAYVIPQSSIHERIAAVSNPAIASVFFIALLIALMLGYVIHRSFRPLRKLTKVANAIGDGQYEIQLPHVEGGEVGTLVRAFREMAASIQSREASLQELNLKLNTSEKQANLIIDTAPEAIILVDMSGNIFRVNEHTLKVFGYLEQELIGKPVEMLIPERFRHEHVQFRQVYNSNPMHRRMGGGLELYAVCKDGSELAVEVGLSYMQFDKERYVIAAISDITQRKQAEKALQKLNVELEQRVNERTKQLLVSNKELEHFAYIASHDLQEPLRMVASYLQLVEKRYKSQLDATAGEFIEFAVDGANRMKQLIDGLLQYSRIQTRARDFETVDMEDVLATVLTDLQIKITERSAVVTHEPLPQVLGDKSQLQRLLLNLINNAIKYCTNDIPKIHVAFEDLSQTTRDLPDDVPASGWLFSVGDNGIGIEPQYYERIFQLFQRLHTRQEFPGTGLGLALCKRIVERHGGHIWVESQPGKGSIFYFVLKKASADVVAPEGMDSTGESPDLVVTRVNE
ncbi:MAG: PAS domain S-box protein [Gammaproteobacteria bacterium]|nr:PAS domain S-box protein [Gammaproteobacteria bacterium]